MQRMKHMQIWKESSTKAAYNIFLPKSKTFNDKAKVTCAALKKMILRRFPQKILNEMHTVDLTAKTDQEITTIFINAGRTTEKWEAFQK